MSPELSTALQHNCVCVCVFYTTDSADVHQRRVKPARSQRNSVLTQLSSTVSHLIDVFFPLSLQFGIVISFDPPGRAIKISFINKLELCRFLRMKTEFLVQYQLVYI